jgi:toxin-antitoxin system PIN domain toxin
VSQTCDVNVLVYASNSASRFHRQAAAFLEDWVSGPGLRYLFWPVLLGYLRIVTHPSVLDVPLGAADAQANVTDLLAIPHVRAFGEVDGFWPAFRAVTDDVPARGNLVPDAHLVALMHQHGVSTIWSHDRDLRKFSGITVRDPFAP